MAVLRNRVNRTMAGADGGESAETGAAAVLESALSNVDRALTVDEDAARNASERLEGSVATLSRSGTVLEALRTAEPSRVFVAESRPAREGIAVAERLAETTASTVTVHTDAAAAHVLASEDVDRVAVGADTVPARRCRGEQDWDASAGGCRRPGRDSGVRRRGDGQGLNP